MVLYTVRMVVIVVIFRVVDDTEVDGYRVTGEGSVLVTVEWLVLVTWVLLVDFSEDEDLVDTFGIVDDVLAVALVVALLVLQLVVSFAEDVLDRLWVDLVEWQLVVCFVEDVLDLSLIHI